MAQKIFQGIGASEGVRIAKAFVYRKPVVDFDREIPAEQAQDEAKRLNDAVEAARSDVDRLIEEASGVVGKDEIGVLKGQKSILADPAYLPQIKNLILQKCFSAEKAVHKVTDQFAALFASMPNPYMKERAADVRDAENRLDRFLSGAGGSDLSDIRSEVILVAEDLSASDTVRLNRKFVAGFASEIGGRTAHASIFAKSMGIPAVVGAPGLLQNIKNGDLLILDAGKGICILSPDKTTVTEYREKYSQEQKQKVLFEKSSRSPAVLVDGGRVIAAANIGSASDAEFSRKQGAEAVGLMRTETLFLSRSSAPTEEEQFAEYKKAAEAFSSAEPGGVVIRTLDIGGDKPAEYLHIPKESNPFLGFRAIRLCLSQRELFQTQLRAILRASAFGKISIMFPMIAGISELQAAKEILEETKKQLDSKSVAYDKKIKTGIMVEVPSAALMADVLAAQADFFSIGTNDLTQYTLAADRGNRQVSYLYDSYDPAVLRLVQMTAQAARKHGIPVGMCGAMAGEPLAIPLLVGLGLDELSMASGAVPQAKYTLGKLSRRSCKEFARKALACSSAGEVRAAAEDFFRHIQ